MRNLDWASSNVWFALSCAFDIAVACAAAAWLARAPSAGRFLEAVATTGTVLALKGIVLMITGVTLPFGVLHVLWLDLLVVAPLAALTYLVASRSTASRWSQAAASSTLLLVPFGLYASFVEPNDLVTERATVDLPAARAGDDPVRVGVVADIQFERVGEHETEAIRALMRERPDVILIAGDIHQGSRAVLAEELPRIRRLLGALRAPGGVFAVHGDSEGPAKLRVVVARTRIRPLVDEIATVRVGDRTLTIGGIELDWRSRGARRTADHLETDAGRGDMRILLAHRPDAVLRLEHDTRIDLTVAGHTHGGQLQLPLIGPLTISSNVPRHVGAGGLHELAGRRIYVTRGVGVERGQAPRLRFGDKPEVSILTLR